MQIHVRAQLRAQRPRIQGVPRPGDRRQHPDSAAGRPAILVPFAAATDDHQTANARELVKAGGARAIAQGNFTPDVLARQIEALAMDPVALNNAAARALSVGRPHAARDLADLVERIGEGIAPVAVGPTLSPRVTARAPGGAMPA